VTVIDSKLEDTSYELLKDNLKQLRYLGERLSKFTLSISHKGHVWTLLKLVFLKLYKDLFAGTGINMYSVNSRIVYTAFNKYLICAEGNLS